MSSAASGGTGSSRSSSVGDKMKELMAGGGRSIRRFGWISFWVQLALSLVSTVIMMFQLSFVGQTKVTAAQLTTMVGVIFGVVSTFWAFKHVQLGRRLIAYALGDTDNRKGLDKQDVLRQFWRGTQINMVGMGSAILGLAALVGMLVGKSLMTSSTNPWQQTQGAPVVALDVFVVQAATNAILCHFVSMVANTWLTQIVSKKF